MTRGQQFVVLLMAVMLIVVLALLGVTLLNARNAASAVPTLVPTITMPPAQPAVDLTAALTMPPTWTTEPTRTLAPTNTPLPTRTATGLPTATRTFAPTFTPRPTAVVTATPAGPTATVELMNPGFQGIRGDDIPGWNWWAEDNFAPGGLYNPETSYDTPLFKQADDPVRLINGPTLQVDATQHLKFKVYVYQAVPVPRGTRVGFEVSAGAYSGSGVVQMAAGILPNGGADCENARWGAVLMQNQEGGVQRISAPAVTAGDTDEITVCLYAEPLYAAISNAAFFDDAELIVE